MTVPNFNENIYPCEFCDYIILAHYQVVMSMKLLKKGDW